MSLIPSESYSFPDHFTSTVVPSRKPKNEQPAPGPIEAGKKRPAIVPLPSPKAQPRPTPVIRRQIPEPVRSKLPVPLPARAPNPALRRVSAPPPRIPEPPIRKMPLPANLKPKVRWNTRAPAMDPAPNGDNGGEQIPPALPIAPAQNVIPMKPARVMRPPRIMPPPPAAATGTIQAPIPEPPAQTVETSAIMPLAMPVESGPVAETPRPVTTANPQADFFEVFAQTGETALSKRRHKAKMRRFIVCETVAVAVLLPLAISGLSYHPTNVGLVWTLNILTITSAVSAALLPILFFAFTPTLPEIDR